MFRKLRDFFSDPESDCDDSPSNSTAISPALAESLKDNWTSTSIGQRNVEVFTPRDQESPQHAVLYLHGHGGIRLADNLVYSHWLQQHNMMAFAPDGGRSWWLDTPSPEFPSETTPQQWILESLIPHIESSTGICPPRVALLGVSMGGQGVLQLSYRHASQFPVVSAISPAVDFHQLYGSGIPLDEMFPDRETARQATVVLNLHPLSWPRHQFFCCDPTDSDWFDGAARLGMKLSSSGILHERDLETSAGGHSWDYFNHMAEPALQNIVKGLQAVT